MLVQPPLQPHTCMVTGMGCRWCWEGWSCAWAWGEISWTASWTGVAGILERSLYQLEPAAIRECIHPLRHLCCLQGALPWSSIWTSLVGGPYSSSPFYCLVAFQGIFFENYAKSCRNCEEKTASIDALSSQILKVEWEKVLRCSNVFIGGKCRRMAETKWHLAETKWYLAQNSHQVGAIWLAPLLIWNALARTISLFGA